MGRGNVTVAIKSTYDDRGTKRAERSFHSFGKTVGKGAAYALGAGGFGGGMYALFDVTRKTIDEFRESQEVGRQTNAVLKSTGKTAGLTAKDVTNLANALSKKTAIDDEAVQSAENLLLTFTNVRNEVGKGNDIFNRATKTVLDMSVALKQDFKSSAIQLGKALNDPVKGITALQRVGVSFNEDQKKQIKTLVEHGKTLQAQKIILRELTKEFGGSAERQKTPWKALNVTLGNVAETLGAKLAPTIDEAAKKANIFIQQMLDGKGAGGRFAKQLTDVFNAVKDVAGVLVDSAKWLGRHPALLKAAGAAWVTYKTAALVQLALVKAAELGLFGRSTTAKVERSAGAAGTRAGRAFKLAFIAGATVGLYDALVDPFNQALEKLTGQIDASDPTHGEGQRRADERSAQKYGSGKNQPKNAPRLQKTAPKYLPKIPKKRGRTASASSAGPMAHTSGNYSKSQLMRLWIDAGGPSSVANTAAAIALAESGGNPSVVNSIGASGLWQIYGLPFPGNPLDPMTNARMAVAKYRGAGNSFSPWTTYTGADTGPGGGPGPKTYVNFLGGGSTPATGGGGATAARAPRQKTAYEKLDNRLGYIGLQVDAGVISEAEGQDRTIAAVNRALPRLHGSNRLRALAVRREARGQIRDRKRTRAQNRAQARQDYADRKATFYDRTLSNPFLQAYLDRQDYLASTGQITQAQADQNKAGALQGAINSGQLSDADVVSATGQIHDLTPTPGSPYGGITDRLSEIDAMVRAGDITPEQARGLKVQTINENLGNPGLTDRERLELRGERADLLKENTAATGDLTDEVKSLKDELKRSNDNVAAIKGTSIGALMGVVAALINGEIGGYAGYAGRALTAGAGSVYRS